MCHVIQIYDCPQTKKNHLEGADDFFLQRIICLRFFHINTVYLRLSWKPVKANRKGFSARQPRRLYIHLFLRKIF